MSGICGIVNFDGAPVDPALLRRMAEAAAYRGPDGIRYWIEGNVGLAHLALHTTPESLRERQPLVNRRGDLVLTADARVDNREELIHLLAVKGHLQEENPTDADLILAAYECWGKECPKQIVGDFAFAIWDQREQRLFCTRDPIGVRQLFYCRQGPGLFFATTISAIIAALGESPPLNEPLVIDFLCWRFDRWIYETVYDPIFRVPASHILEANGEGAWLARYWVFGTQSSHNCRTQDEYVEHFRNLFREAVRCRLRSITPAGIFVSGGLDSSSVACMTAHIINEDKGGIQQDIRLYSCLFSGYEAADECDYLEAVLETCQRFSSTRIPGESIWGFKELGTNETFHLNEPDIYPIRSFLTTMLRKAQEQGCRVALTGEGGDQILSASAYWTPDFIFDLNFQQAATELKHFWRRDRQSTIRTLCKLALSTARPITRFIRTLIKPIFFSGSPKQVPVSELPCPSLPWVKHTPVNVSKNARFKMYSLPPPGHLASHSARAIYHRLGGGWTTALLSYLDSVGSSIDMEYRFPYFDRRLIDFQMMIPTNLRFTNGLTKVILRESMIEVLPEKVRLRPTFAHFSEVADYGLREKERAKVITLLERIETDQSRYIDTRILRSAWQAYYTDTKLPQLPLLAPLLLQNWMQSCG